MLVRDADTRRYELTVVSEPLAGIAGERLRNKIRKSIQGGAQSHVLDLRRLEELDSATLAALIRVLRLVRSAGGDVGLIVEQEKILRILSITALDRVFSIFRDEEAAERAVEMGCAIPA